MTHASRYLMVKPAVDLPQSLVDDGYRALRHDAQVAPKECPESFS